MKRFTKQILTVAVLLFAVLTANAQNKAFTKYSDMKGVDYMIINESMLDVGAAVLNEMIEDENSPLVTKMQKMLIITTSDKGAKKKLAADVKSLSSGDYEDLMTGSSDGSKYSFLFNEKSTPREFVIYVNDGKDATVMVIMGNFTKDEILDSMDE